MTSDERRRPLSLLCASDLRIAVYAAIEIAEEIDFSRPVHLHKRSWSVIIHEALTAENEMTAIGTNPPKRRCQRPGQKLSPQFVQLIAKAGELALGVIHLS